MKKILALILTLFPFSVFANPNLTKDEIILYTNEICKSTFLFSFIKVEAINVIDKSTTTVNQFEPAEIEKQKLNIKYKNLNNDEFNLYTTVIDLKGKLKNNKIGREVKGAGICILGIAGEDIVSVKASFALFIDHSSGPLPTDIIDGLLHHKSYELKPLLDVVRPF